MRPAGGLRLVDLGRRRDLWPVESPYDEITLLQCGHVLLVISALWSQNNIKPYVYPTGSVRCPFGYSTGLCGCHTGLGTSYDQSCWVVRCPSRTHRNHKICEPPNEAPGNFSGPMRAETLIARHVARAHTTF